MSKMSVDISRCFFVLLFLIPGRSSFRYPVPKMSSHCECQFEDTAYLSSSCGANVTLFMTLLDMMIRSHCDLTDPCNRTQSQAKIREEDTVFDFIVVGGGVAGSVVAGRLSENPKWRVALLEAGPEEPSSSSIPAFATSAIGTSLDWQYKTERQEGACLNRNGICRWPRGKMLAGTGAMTGMMYTRGHPEIFDDWARQGNQGWSYEEVLPYFKKAESNLNLDIVDSEYHGTDGPMNVQRFAHQPPFTETFLEAAKELGFAIHDLNGKNMTGFSVAQCMVKDGLRASTYRMYVRQFLKQRPNLKVFTRSQVTKILINPITKRAFGVQFIHNDRRHVFVFKRELILSAGAVGSPHILMLSGVGPERDLKEVGITPIVDLKVGENLHHHVSVGIKMSIDEPDYNLLTRNNVEEFMRTRSGPLASTGLTQTTGFIQTSFARNNVPDVQIYMDGFGSRCSKTGQEDECSDGERKSSCGNRQLFARPTNVMAQSKGYLKLVSANPMKYPVIQPNYLSNYRDVEVLIEGLRFIMKLARTKTMQAKGMQVDRTPAKGCEGFDFESYAYWECLIRRNTLPENHPAGSCKMGPEGDPTAVIDPELRVHGVPNVRVVDASSFPYVANSNPIASIIMLAEKGADMIKETWSEPPKAA
nr:PREDICTED: glucose dehydrogenase [FAD, quinone]-like [Bemisia tabaci]